MADVESGIDAVIVSPPIGPQRVLKVTLEGLTADANWSFTTHRPAEGTESVFDFIGRLPVLVFHHP